MNTASNRPCRTRTCLTGGFVFDEATGLPEGASSRPRRGDAPINRTCPEYGVREEDFELVEI